MENETFEKNGNMRWDFIMGLYNGRYGEEISRIVVEQYTWRIKQPFIPPMSSSDNVRLAAESTESKWYPLLPDEGKQEWYVSKQDELSAEERKVLDKYLTLDMLRRVPFIQWRKLWIQFAKTMSLDQRVKLLKEAGHTSEALYVWEYFTKPSVGQ